MLLLLLLPLFVIVNVFSQGMTAHIKACGLLAHCDFGELVEKAGWSPATEQFVNDCGNFT